MSSNATREEALEKVRDLGDVKEGPAEVVTPEDFFDDVIVTDD